MFYALVSPCKLFAQTGPQGPERYDP